MINPVPSGVRSEGELTYRVSVDFFVEVEKDTEAGMCKDDMCGFGENVIVLQTYFRCCDSLRCQVLLDREVRKLYDLAAPLIDDGDQTRACGYRRFFCILRVPSRIEGGRCFFVELDCKDLREFIDTKRANRYSETSKEPLCKFSSLLVNIQQCTAISFVQCLRQVIQNLPNTDGKCATQPVSLADHPAEPARPCERSLY